MTKKQSAAGPTEQPPSKAFTSEEVKKMKENIPTALETIFDLPEGEGKNIYDLLSVQLGAQMKDIYSVLERTELTEQEIPIFSDLISKAEHGINMTGMDFPIVPLAERLVIELRARRSKGRESSHEFERTTTAWLAALRAREEAQKRESEKNKFVGS